MRFHPTVIIGAGQAGLAMSRCLTERSIEHVVLERGEIANAWRRDRWDSLRLLTPNWQSRLPGGCYEGDDPDGFMTMPEVIRRLDDYAAAIAAPVRTETTVVSVRPTGDGYDIDTNQGPYRAGTVVLASGACNIASVPKCAAGLPGRVFQTTSLRYKRPSDLPPGAVLVVGGSATGVQLAHEIQASGRQVVLSVGEHVRAPRDYRSRDVKWWMDAVGLMDQRYDEVDDLARVRRTPSLQLIGAPDRRMADLNALTDAGVEIVGRLADVRDGKALFSGGLANHCAAADLKLDRMLDLFDEWAAARGLDRDVAPPHRFAPTRVPAQPRLALDLAGGDVASVVWATGYRPDYSWLHAPVFDRKGRLRHDGGVVDAPGLYAMGLTFMRRRKSTLIDGVGDDARALVEHMLTCTDRIAA